MARISGNVGAVASVSSVFGRNGGVVAVNGDYSGVVAAHLTGATAATRYVGGTASGAPAAGTFAVGDFVIEQTGKVYVCTVAGTPGTWAAVGGTSPDVLLAVTPLTSVQILALGTTAVPVTPTPGPAEAIMVLQVWSVYHFVTTPYGGNDPLRVTPNYRGGNAFAAQVPQVLNYGFDATVWWDQSGKYAVAAVEYDHTDLVGSPWALKSDDNVAPPITGDGTLTMFCTYVKFSV